MATRNCDNNESEKQRQAARDKRYKYSFAPTIVHIESVDTAQQLVTYTAKGSNALNTVRWREPEVWAECPTTIGAANGGLPSAGDAGTLYLGEQAYGRLDASAQQHTRPKWPEELSTAGGYLPTKLQILALKVDYCVAGSSEVRTADLSSSADPNQQLDLRGVYAPLTVRDGAGQKTVQANVLRVAAHARSIANGEEGDVDLMAPGFAEACSVISLGDRTDVNVKLSQRGRNRFLLGTHPVAPPGETASTSAGFSPRPSPAESSVAGGGRSRFLTLLAAPSGAPAGATGDGDFAIKEIEEHLLGANAWFEKVSSLGDIARVLRVLRGLPDRERPHTIQIVGHGAPGMLALGYHWDQRYTDDDDGPFYLLDSNPYAYGLLEELVHRDTMVLLVGCEVGSNHSAQFVARGSALIYDLHAMWRCDVLAADQLVGPRDFVDGRFVGSAQGYVGGRWVKSDGLASTFSNQFGVDAPAGLPYDDIRLTAVPALGAAQPRVMPAIDTSPLARYTSKVHLTQPLLAMPEVSFSAKAKNASDDNVTLHLIGNGSLLQAVHRTARDVAVHYYAVDDRDDSPHTRLYGSPSQKIWAEIKKKRAPRG
jgi:hypothetical protein